MITVGSVDSIRNLPTTALFGTSLVFLLTISALLFLLPCALVSAELGSTWTERGGIYVWVREAFGNRMGVVAIWLQWAENVIWYPAILSFTVASLGFLIHPQLAVSKYFLMSVICVLFWSLTIINLFGIKLSAMVANLCSLFGLIIPMAFIIVLGIIWFFTGKHSEIHFNRHALMPHLFDKNMWVALTGIMVSFFGIELTTVHASNVKNPQHAYPRALLYSTIIIVVTMLLGALSLAEIIPEHKISLVAGVIQAYDLFFTHYHMHWLMPLIAVMLVIGGAGSVNNWIIAPTRGLMMAAEDGNLPPLLKQKNRHGAPKLLLILQACLVTVLTLVFLLVPSVNGAVWLLTALTAILYMIMYILLFMTGIKLRKTAATRHRPFKIPGGNLGMWIVASTGTLAATLTIIVSFIPVPGMQIGSIMHYELLICTGVIGLLIPPFILYLFRPDKIIPQV